MDPELRAIIEKISQRLDETKGLKPAIEQLESQMAGIPATIERKLDAVRAASWDPRSGSYRGFFKSEDDARCFGLCVLAFAGQDQRAREALQGEMKNVYERALGGTQEAGEGLIPVEYSARIDQLVEATGVFARLAFPMSMSSDQLTFQRRTSSLVVFKTGRNVAATASDLGFTSVNLNADEWNVLSLYPKSMSADAAASIGEMVAIEIATAFSTQIDTCGLVGDGTPNHLDVQGITTRLAAINGVNDGGGLVLASGNAWSEIVEDDISKLIGQAKMFAGFNPAFVCSNQFFWQVMNPINNAKGGVSRAEFTGRQSLVYQGWPVEVTPAMPQTEANSQIPLLFGDIRMSSTHGRRKDLTIEESRDVKFIERQICALGTQRHAVVNHTLGDADTPGPVVGLITAAG